MYDLSVAKVCKKQLKRIKRSGKYPMDRWTEIVELLLYGRPLPPKCLDHQLHGSLHMYRECHLTGDWLLVYRIYPERNLLELAQTGSHSELF